MIEGNDAFSEAKRTCHIVKSSVLNKRVTTAGRVSAFVISTS
jgi:hypothetical protein